MAAVEGASRFVATTTQYVPALPLCACILHHCMHGGAARDAVFDVEEPHGACTESSAMRHDTFSTTCSARGVARPLQRLAASPKKEPGDRYAIKSRECGRDSGARMGGLSNGSPLTHTTQMPGDLLTFADPPASAVALTAADVLELALCSIGVRSLSAVQSQSAQTASPRC